MDTIDHSKNNLNFNSSILSNYPFLSAIKSGKTIGIIFSKDRAMQLDCTLRSFFKNCIDPEDIQLNVLYKSSSMAHQNQYRTLETTYSTVHFVQETVFKHNIITPLSSFEYVLFMVDDNIFVRNFSIVEMQEALKLNPGAIGFSLRLGTNTTYCYMHSRKQNLPSYVRENNVVIKFDWSKGELDFSYPLEVSSSLYRTEDLLPLINQLEFNNPNLLELQMDSNKNLFLEGKPTLLSYKQSVAFCNPVNMVQTMWVNKAGNNENYTPQMLSELFSRGYRIDLKCFSGFVPNSCHQEVKLNFTEPDHQTIPKPNNPPLVSIIILSYNGLNHIEACLESIRRNTKESYEIIVVDNARKDGSIDYLRNVNDIVLIQNPENVGPAVARAQAMVMAQGEYLTFLDDDTIVPQGWLTKFIQLAERHPEIGMFGPLSNYASGLQHVPEASYHNLEEFEEFARQWSKQHKGQLSAAVRLVSFCLFIKRAVVEKIGTFDGNFGLFGFEDDDFSLRTHIAGFKPTIANEIFIHHTGGPQGRGSREYNQRLLEAWVVFKKKWGLPEELPYGSSYGDERIISQVFDFKKHYVPLPEKFSIERLVYTKAIEKKINAIFSKAQRDFAEGNWDDALRAFQVLLTENPNLGVAHAGLGSAFFGKGDYPAAVTHLKRAVDLLPGEIDIKISLAEAHYLSGNKSSAIQTLKMALEQSPENVSLLLKLIDLLRAENQIHQVAEYTLRAVKIAPNNSEVLVAFGRLGIDLGYSEALQTAFEKLKQIAPDHPIFDEWSEALSSSKTLKVPDENRLDNTDPGSTLNPFIVHKSKETKGLPSIVVVISTEPKNIKQFLTRLQQHTSEFYEIILVGNESKGRALKKWRPIFPAEVKFKYLSVDKQLGLAGSFNLGLKETKGDFIVLLSDKVLITKGWLIGLLECIQSVPEAGMVGPMMSSGIGPQFVADADYLNNLDDYSAAFYSRNRHRRISVRSLGSQCLVIKREVFEKIGPLDETLEDDPSTFEDYCARVALKGYSLLLACDVFVHHSQEKPLKSKPALKKNRSNFNPNTEFGRNLFRLNALQEAKQFYYKDQIEKSIQTLINEIKYCPEDKAIYHLLCEILIDAKRFTDGLEALNGLPENCKKEPKALAHYGYCKAGLDLLEQAEIYADEALLLLENFPLALNLKGRIAVKRKDWVAAELYFQKVIEADPGYGEPFSNLGEIRWFSGKKEEALDLFEKGLILSPTETEILSLYQKAVTELGQFLRAETILKEAKTLFPNHKKLSFSYITILLAQEKYALAMSEIESHILTHGIEDDILAAALEIRKKIGPLKVSGTPPLKDTLSVCMIVKNEEEHLARCLMSLIPIADEIIVVDTGSMDRTKDIACLFGAQVYDYTWKGNFSEARNYSISKAKGTWILVHDADEVLSRRDYSSLKAILGQNITRPEAYSITTRNYTINQPEGWTANVGDYPEEEAGTGWLPTTKVRLFVNDPAIHFEGHVHEAVEPSLLLAGIKIRKGNIPIHHYGRLDVDKTLTKAEEYYHLGIKKLEEGGDDYPRALRELAIQAGELGKYEESIDLWKRLIGIGVTEETLIKALFNMGSCYFLLGRYQDSLITSKKVMELDPRMKENILTYASSELCIGDENKAIAALAGIAEQGTGYPPALADLMTAYFLTGNKEEGLTCMKKLHSLRVSVVEYLHSFAQFLIKAGRIGKAVILLETAIETGNLHQDTQTLLAECRTRLGET